MMETDSVQGELIQSLQTNILQITLVLELIVILFSIAFSRTFSKRLNKVMTSMRIIQDGDYTHKLEMGGNDELTILGNEFNDLTERLNTSEQKRRRFVSDASHELKTPLASIKLLTDSILQNDMDAETIREFVGDIGDEAERLNRMTAKLLSLTKVDGDPVVDSEIIYMSPTIQRVVRRLSAIADQAFITIDLQLDQDVPILILEDDLYQIVYNLIENGIKYNVPDGTLTVTLLHEDDNALLQVTDTGMGIPEDAIDHIFERFYRVDKARSRQSGGSGLGLAIVKTIVERNKGEISVASTLGKGTTFTVTFPAFDTEVDKT
jgi:signal transduction histidine kinase